MEKFSAWRRGAERRLETLPGVLSASLEGDLDRATEVRLRVEEDAPVSEILDAVRAALEENADECPLGAFFRIQVGSVGDESPYIQDEIHEDPAVASRDTPESGGIRLITHQVRDVSPGVMGVELTLGLLGRRFAGGASGQANSPGKDRVPALATLSALGSYIRFASEGVSGPTLALESVSQFSLGSFRVAVVVVTMSGHAAPLIASWPLTGASGPAVVRATLEAAARRVTRLSAGGDRRPREATQLVELAGVAGSGRGLRQRAESLLESTRAIASARIVRDQVQGVRIHVLATSEIPRWEVSRMVVTLLEENLGFRVRFDQITVAQSRLSAEELDRVLGRTSPGVSADAAAAFFSRLTLVDLYIVAKMGGKQEVGVRIVGGGGSVDSRCKAPGGGEVLLRPLAEATLDAVGRLIKRGGRQVALVLKDVRRFKRRGDQGVVVLVEAMAGGRKTLLSGAAFSADSFERASVVAVLQATNGLVAGALEFPGAVEEKPKGEPVPPGHTVPRTSQPPRPQTGSATPRDQSTERRSDSSETAAPNDYVSEVLSRIQSTRGRGPEPSKPSQVTNP